MSSHLPSMRFVNYAASIRGDKEMVTEVGRDMNAQDDQHMQRLGKAQ